MAACMRQKKMSNETEAGDGCLEELSEAKGSFSLTVSKAVAVVSSRLVSIICRHQFWSITSSQIF